jgi:hypothetical protein
LKLIVFASALVLCWSSGCRTQVSQGNPLAAPQMPQLIWSTFPENVLVWQEGDQELARIQGNHFSIVEWVDGLQSTALTKGMAGIYVWDSPHATPRVLLDYKRLSDRITFDSGPYVSISKSGDRAALYFELTGDLYVVEIASHSIIAHLNKAELLALTGATDTICHLVQGVAINPERPEVAISIPSKTVRDDVSGTQQTETFIVDYKNSRANHLGAGAPVVWIDGNTLLCLFREVLPEVDMPHGQEKEARLYVGKKLTARVERVDDVSFDGVRILLTRRVEPHRDGILETGIMSSDLKASLMKTELAGIRDFYRIALVQDTAAQPNGPQRAQENVEDRRR